MDTCLIHCVSGTYPLPTPHDFPAENPQAEALFVTYSVDRAAEDTIQLLD